MNCPLSKVIGITGHQNLGTADDVDWIRSALLQTLQRSCASCAVTSLATGADQLFAECALECGIDLCFVQPSDGYVQTFKTQKDKARYERLAGLASRVVRLPFPSPSEQAFLKAGEAVADLSDLLIAVWNGEPARGLGGTADVVHYSLDKGKNVFQINPRSRTVRSISNQMRG